jgi:hypothetical protein
MLDVLPRGGPECPLAPEVPEELARLAERVGRLPDSVREALLPAMEEALEQAVFRGRVLSLAREALERFRHDMELIRFDLDRTREEREELRRRLREGGGGEPAGWSVVD